MILGDENHNNYSDTSDAGSDDEPVEKKRKLLFTSVDGGENVTTVEARR